MVADWKAVKGGVPRLGEKLVSGVNRTDLWCVAAPCRRMDGGRLGKGPEADVLEGSGVVEIVWMLLH